jgi:hypothetical protein
LGLAQGKYRPNQKDHGLAKKYGLDEIAYTKQKREDTQFEYFPASQQDDRSLQIAPSYSYYDFCLSCPSS